MPIAPFAIVQPWGRDLARESTVVSEHPTIAEAFRQIDVLAETMNRTGTPPELVQLFVLDAEGRIIQRPDAH